jgi:hypothetical protein
MHSRKRKQSIRCINLFIWNYLQTNKKGINEEETGSVKKKKRLTFPMHPTHSIPSIKTTKVTQRALTSPTNPSLDWDFIVDIFTSFAENIEKRIEDIIEKEMVKVEKVEKIQTMKKIMMKKNNKNNNNSRLF